MSFSLDSGSSMALVGKTGSGKSTIVKLVSKLYSGYKGKISIDGYDLNDLNGTELRKKIAIVPQDIVLFNGSIEFNITLGDPAISLEKAMEAAKTVGIADFIEGLPGKYHFVIREQGGNLSHGQKQLIVFARALARDPKLPMPQRSQNSL